MAAIGQSGFMELPVRTVDVAAAARLPLHYSGRFDRLLVGQAITEPLRLLTADAVLARYSDLVALGSHPASPKNSVSRLSHSRPDPETPRPFIP